ncbi:DNA-binding transcriptional regulator, XRE family [Paenibacillus algorifonticola]|uniref:DNA-binding transcriptional regulator, XRE family n=1 Tax=Paenibacillus algorifonticola TaxID=684063 RepID=A0A1I2AJL6_9BACL|nr:helix-turn-helix domain-containing protein [Paenibacillus algorifonticola]SFE43060.1 DNA-binding transcriptional regulator, XRE family [Paenibacillus algorifonticola]
MAISYKPLFRLLTERELTKSQFREAIGMGTTQLAKMGKGEYIALELIDKICAHFDVQPGDVIEYVKEPKEI